MRTLRTVLVGIVAAAAFASAASAEEPTFVTLTITAKRPNAGAAVAERVPPEAAVVIAAPLPVDMPEIAIDPHMAPIGALPAPAAVRAAS